MTLDAASATCCCGNQPILSCRQWSDCHEGIESLSVTISCVVTHTIRANDGSTWNHVWAGAGTGDFVLTYAYQISGTLNRIPMYDDLDGLPIYGFRGFLTGAISGGGEYPNPYPPPSWFQPINVPVQPCDPAWPWFPDCGIVDQVQKLGEVSAAATMSLDTVIACVQFPDTGEFGAQILHFWPLTWTIGAPQHSGSGQFVESVICPDPSAPNPNVKPWPNPWGYARTEVDVLGGGQGPPDLSNQLVLRGCVRGPWSNPSFEETSIYQYASQYAGAFGYEQFVPPFFVPICEWDITIGEWTVTRTMQLAVTVV